MAKKEKPEQQKAAIGPLEPKPPKKSGKLIKKAKSRLPRRQKTQAKKAAL
jgi:hypothetical protein